jgi:hypothetical protein
MEMLSTIDLPGVLTTASSDGVDVWCAVGDRILVFEGSGAPRHTLPAPAGLGSLVRWGDHLVAALEPGVVAWLDPESGRVEGRRPVGGAPRVVADAVGAWVVEPTSGRAWRIAEPGVLVEPLTVGDVDRVAPDGERLWWTSRGDTLLRSPTQRVDVGVATAERGGVVACAGSVWLSVAGGLVRVGTWAAQAGPVVPAPFGPVPFLVCASGVLVGGGGEGLFVLDPAIDADVRRLDVDAGGELVRLVAAGHHIWAFPKARPEARVLQLYST